MAREHKARWQLGAAKEPLRWLGCFAAAGLIHSYAYLHHLRQTLGLGAAARPNAVRVKLVPADRMPLMLRHRVEQPGGTGQLTVRRLPAPREPLDEEQAKKLLEEARLKDGPLEMAPNALRERIEQVALRRLTEGTKDPAKAMAKAGQMTKGVSAESAREIADYLGYEPTEYVPKDPPPPGDFDFDDCVLYDLEKAKHPDGTPTYRVTLVDRAGRSHTFLVPPGEDPSQYDTVYNLLQMAKENESLNIILRRMVLPLTSKLARTMKQQRAGGQPAKPPADASPTPRPAKPLTAAPPAKSPPKPQPAPKLPPEPDDNEW